MSDGRTGDARRWIVGGAFAIALHGAAFLLLQKAPEPAGFASQVPVEMDILPPPPGAAQMDQAGADQTSDEIPEELPEITPEDVTTTELEPLDTPLDEPQIAQMELPPDVTAAPPDIEPAVALPPQETVTAKEEQTEPPKPKVTPPPKKPELEKKPKPEPKKELARQEPKPDAKPAEKPKPASTAQQAGGSGGVSANAGASKSTAAAYNKLVTAALRARIRPQNFSGRAVVRFTLNRAGRIISLSVSGSGPAAAAAEAIVRSASFPPFFKESTATTTTITVPIAFKPQQ